MHRLPAVDIRLARHGSREYLEAVELRDRVLRRPLGRSFTATELAAEAGQLHLTLYLEGGLAACAALRRDTPTLGRMRQVAVKPDLQGHGLGRILIGNLEALALAHGVVEIMLHARQTAVPFYLRLGYEIVGEPLQEVGLPHLPMRRMLTMSSCGPGETPR